MDAAVRDAAAQVQLGELLHRYPRELSGGQRQRVALARAIIRRPSVFLMDEPLSNLDAKLRGHMRAELKHMQQALGITTIYVTHDQIEAMTLAHRVAILGARRAAAARDARRNLQQPGQSLRRPVHRLAAHERGARAPSRVRGSWHDGAKIATPVGGRIGKAVLGVRPEDCSVAAPAKGDIKGEIYTTELIGDHTLVTVKAGSDMLTVKAAKDFTARRAKRLAWPSAPTACLCSMQSEGLRVR